MDADGWATALYVLGVDEGLLVVESNLGLEALFITATNDGDLKASYSSGFLEKTDYQPIKTRGRNDEIFTSSMWQRSTIFL